MRAPRFFCPFALQAHTEITLPEALSHYAGRVLRLSSGANITLFDGRGGEFPATIRFQDKQAIATLGPHHPREAELAGQLHVMQALASGDKMDWIIEKAVELGVSEFTPIAGDRSIVQLKGERLQKRMAHWERIAQAASEQCGRNRIMTIHPLATLSVALPQLPPNDNRQVLFCHPDYGEPLDAALRDQGSIEMLTLVIGPEGGWSPQELDIAKQHHLAPIQFGPRVLRTETAGIALAAASIALLGWHQISSSVSSISS